MQGSFSSIVDFYTVLDKLIPRLNDDPTVREGLLAAKLLLRFRYHDFDGELNLDLTGERIGWATAKAVAGSPLPDVEFILDTDTANEFFNGALNVPLALATRRIVAKGSITKALKLLPAIKPVFDIYRSLLREIGRADLIVQKKQAASRAVRGTGLFKRLGAIIRLRGRANHLKKDPRPALPIRNASEPLPAMKFNEHALPKDLGLLKIEMLRRMLLIRRFEESLADAFASGELRTEAIHLSIGQEAAAVGACFALNTDDWINTTHRGHGHILAKGADAKRVMAEIFGREVGVCRGRGGSMHVIDLPCGVMGSNGIVGAGLLLADGCGWSAQYRKTGQVSAVFFGDGATNQGMFHEACNFAAVVKLPVIFVCENNLYGEFTAFADHCAVESVSVRSAAYGIPAQRVDGNDVLAVYEAMKTAVDRARRGEGPTLLECVTYRWHGHMEGETAAYRSEAEIEAWKEKCPIVRFERALIDDRILAESTARRLREETTAAIDEALQFAREAKDPAPDDALCEVYAPEPPEVLAGDFELTPSGPTKSMSIAINEAIAEEMTRDETVVLLGEDVRLGGYFGVTVGLVERFGKARVVDTPISEYAIVGAAVGAAATGLRPICEILFSDFLTTCADPLVNQAAKLRYMSGGQNQAPLVLRTPVGGYIGMAAQHSQCLEGIFAGLPGLIVCAPSDAYSAKGILKSAIRSSNPVLFFEHKLLYADTSTVPEADYILPLGKARIRRRGKHVTVVGILYGAGLAMAAAEQLEADGVSCEVIDPVTLYPLDVETLAASLRRTGRLLVVEEAHESFGFGARIVSELAETSWDALRAPPVRVAALNAPIPYSKPLELAVLPDVGRVVAANRSLVD